MPRLASLPLFALLIVAGAAPAQAQPTGGETVVWAAGPPARADRRGHAVVTVKALIREGWHVYALKQSDTGPLPLRVSIDANAAVAGNGGPRTGKPVAAFDPAFGQVTPYHVGVIDLALPVRLQAGAGAGRFSVPVSVRFQSCDGRICEPPRTVRLTAVVEAHAG